MAYTRRVITDRVPMGNAKSNKFTFNLAGVSDLPGLIAALSQGVYGDMTRNNALSPDPNAGVMAVGTAVNAALLQPIEDTLASFSATIDIITTTGAFGGWGPYPLYTHEVYITSSQNWTVPADVTQIGLVLVGGGNSGGSYVNGYSGYGGTSGRVLSVPMISVIPGSSNAVTIGAGGNPVTTGTGSAGGTTTAFGYTASSPGSGGGGNIVGSNSSAPNIPNGGSNGGNGGQRGSGSTTNPFNGKILSGGGAGPGGTGGYADMGVGGNQGADGQQPGGGGGIATATGASGAGAPGGALIYY